MATGLACSCFAAAGLAAAAAVAIGFTLWSPQPGSVAVVAAHKSYLHVNERLALPDGSRVELKDGSDVVVLYSAAERRVKLTGGEAHFTVAKTQAGNFTLKALGDVTRATLHDGSNVPRIPPWRLGGGVELETDRLDAGMTLLYAGRQDKVGAFDTSTPGYVSLNAQIAWRPFRARFRHPLRHAEGHAQQQTEAQPGQHEAPQPVGDVARGQADHGAAPARRSTTRTRVSGFRARSL
mgnify:CR=1 FL=1